MDFDLEISQIEVDAINSVMEKIYEQAKRSGWWTDPRETGTLIALMHSELSEALEADRKNLMDDHLPQYKGVPTELADCIIRILDFCGHYNYDIGTIIKDKHFYNGHRDDHKLENRINDKHGKKY